MSDPEKVYAVVREWVEKAENDLENAARVLLSGDDGPADTICFHAQQCVEKYFKALLVFKGVPFPKTHNIRDLLALIPSGLKPAVEIAEQDLLTEYATVTRYPGEYEPVSIAEARKAVRIARRIRKEVRHRLPKTALRGKK